MSRLRTALAAAGATIMLATAGCGDGARAGAHAPPRAIVGAPAPLQSANGPVAVTPGTQPLTLRSAPAGEQVHPHFRHEPRSGLLFDLDTGEVLWQRLPTRVLPIASLTKIMTALLVDEADAPGARARITRDAVMTGGSKVGVLPRGKEVAVRTLLNGLLLPSGNDAAVALAEHTSGSVGRFVAAMNARAQAMGLTCTRFASPSGLVDHGNHSCAVDLAQLARVLLDRPRLAAIVRRRSAVLPLPVRSGHVWLYNHNPLLRMGYPGTIGVKTGFTDAAGRCFVAAVRRAGRRLGVVLLHSSDPGTQARKLLDLGFRVSGTPN